ncbi:hypothetical protein D3OALGA1CA_5129 [Olavius algarvensis associated proteobacterium Delta 3]|nr:hypothetical protein D3OALGA1CA_5129 [Olavius algarvensis associated proteobacterium Delta 3]
MEPMTAALQRAQRNCIFPRIPETGILGNGFNNRLKFYRFYQMIVLHVALQVLFILSLLKGLP